MDPQKLLKLHTRRLLNGIGMGSIEIVRDCLERGVDPNWTGKLGRTPLIKAVRAMVLESGVVDLLLEFGADPRAEDSFGRTALDYARTRLARLGPGPDRIRRSPSLDEQGNLRLAPHEEERLAGTRRTDPEIAAAFEALYRQTRRQAALRQHLPRRDLKIIIARLEEVLGGPPPGESNAQRRRAGCGLFRNRHSSRGAQQRTRSTRRSKRLQSDPPPPPVLRVLRALRG